MKKVVILSGIMIGLCGCPDAELFDRKQRDRDTYNTQVQQKVAQEGENDVRKWQQQVAQELENDECKWQQAENRRQEHLARLNAATSLVDFKEFIREKREKYESTPWNEIRFWEVEYGDLNVDQMRREWYCANHLKLLLQPQIRNLILEGKVVMGMTAEQVRASLGEPREVNRTVHRYGTHEQWVYGNRDYLYFENDILDPKQANTPSPRGRRRRWILSAYFSCRRRVTA